MKTVAVMVWDRIPAFELSMPCEVFGIDRSEMGVPNYRLLLCGMEPGPLRAVAGFTLQVPHGASMVDEADTVILPAWRDIDETPTAIILDAVRRAYERGARIVSLCSGAFVLAAAGLLDGRRATTHWMFTDVLAARYPKIRVDPRVLYIDEGQILTSAGTAAGIDLCLHLVRKDYGAAVANVFARRMLVSPHRDGGQAQYVPAAVKTTPASTGLTETMEWALARLGEPLDIRRLAARAGLPVRTFARHFRDAAGVTPGQWLIGQRVLAARHALETGDDSVERIAYDCGFGTAASMRLHFGRSLGISPTTYRRRFEQGSMRGGLLDRISG